MNSARAAKPAKQAKPPKQAKAPKPAKPAAPSAGRLRWWWLLAAGLAGSLVLMSTTHLLRGTAAMGGTLLLVALIRLVLPKEAAGAIAVRSKWLDILMLVLAAAAVLGVGFTLNLLPLE